MTYNNITGEVCVARVIDKFNIKTSDWIARSNEWIARCMNELHIYRSFEPCYDTLDVSNYRFKLPCDLKILDAVVKNTDQVISKAINGILKVIDNIIDKLIGK